MKRTTIKTVFGPPVEFQGSIAEVFNLAGQATGNGWRNGADRAQEELDQAEAARRQPDMFPDVDINPATARKEAKA